MPNKPRSGQIIRAFWLIEFLFFLAACSPIPISATPTPTEGPQVCCTAPACWEDEVYSCQGSCPCGCGTFCATITPDPLASPTPTIPPFSSICTLPTVNPGTQKPYMVACAGSNRLHVGETVQVAVQITGLQYSDYILVQGKDTSIDFPGSFTAKARIGNHPAKPVNSGSHLSLDRVQSDDDRIFLILTAQSAGVVEISFQVIPTYPDIQTSLTVSVLP